MLSIKDVGRLIKKTLVYGGIDRVDYEEIKEKFEKDNIYRSLVFATIAFILTTTMFISSYYEKNLMSSRPIYEFGMIMSLIQIGVDLAAFKRRRLSYLSMYLAVITYLCYGLFLATISRPEEQTVTFIAMLIFVPLLFVDRPIRMMLAQSIFVVIFVFTAIPTKRQDILSVDIIDATIFGFLSVISILVLYRNKITEYRDKLKLQNMSQLDQLTALKNRNSFELEKPTFTVKNKSAICVYIDVNELHEVNNQQGHKAGDIMLCCVADTIKTYFGKKYSYRIGGDEFVIFIFDDSLDTVKEKLQMLQNDIESKNYNIATGYGYMDEFDDSLDYAISQAETMMYKNKVAYYNKKGLELRTIKKDINIDE